MEPISQNNDINAIQETRQLLNELRSNLSREEMNRIREKLYKKETVYSFLKMRVFMNIEILKNFLMQ